MTNVNHSIENINSRLSEIRQKVDKNENIVNYTLILDDVQRTQFHFRVFDTETNVWHAIEYDLYQDRMVETGRVESFGHLNLYETTRPDDNELLFDLQYLLYWENEKAIMDPHYVKAFTSKEDYIPTPEEHTLTTSFPPQPQTELLEEDEAFENQPEGHQRTTRIERFEVGFSSLTHDSVGECSPTNTFPADPEPSFYDWTEEAHPENHQRPTFQGEGDTAIIRPLHSTHLTRA